MWVVQVVAGAVAVKYKGLHVHRFRPLKETGEEEGIKFAWEDDSLTSQQKYDILKVTPEMQVSVCCRPLPKHPQAPSAPSAHNCLASTWCALQERLLAAEDHGPSPRADNKEPEDWGLSA